MNKIVQKELNVSINIITYQLINRKNKKKYF